MNNTTLDHDPIYRFHRFVDQHSTYLLCWKHIPHENPSFTAYGSTIVKGREASELQMVTIGEEELNVETCNNTIVSVTDQHGSFIPFTIHDDEGEPLPEGTTVLHRGWDYRVEGYVTRLSLQDTNSPTVKITGNAPHEKRSSLGEPTVLHSGKEYRVFSDDDTHYYLFSLEEDVGGESYPPLHIVPREHVVKQY